MKTIIDAKDIINTYSEKDQKACVMYKKYKELMLKHPGWGYKRLSKKYDIPISKSRWWHHTDMRPVALSTAAWLESKGLLSLKSNDYRVNWIASILGASFGDGGIFATRNGIFLSSSEFNAVEVFKSDLIAIFGEEIRPNFSIVKGGEYGNSWSVRCSNRAVIRFFEALGAPVGKKTKLDLKVPDWVSKTPIAEEAFFSAFFGSELGVPKMHITGNHLDSFAIAITGPKELKESRVSFMEGIRNYLTRKGIKTTKLYVRYDTRKSHYVFKLGISGRFSNVMRFLERLPLTYCVYKQVKLDKTMKQFKDLKLKCYKKYVGEGKSHQRVMNILNLDRLAFSYITGKVGAEIWA